MYYLKIILSSERQSKSSDDLTDKAWRLAGKVFSLMLPKANPDFDNKIDLIREWLIEIDTSGPPNREIGIDQHNKVIMIMPWKNNCGFWAGNNLELKDFVTSFKTEEIEQKIFEDFWSDFASRQSE